MVIIYIAVFFWLLAINHEGYALIWFFGAAIPLFSFGAYLLKKKSQLQREVEFYNKVHSSKM